MNKTFVRCASVLLMLLLSFCIFAEGNTEYATSSVSEPAVKSISLLKEYQEKLKSYQDEYEKLYVDLQMAYDKSDSESYIKARNAIRALEVPVITQEESELIENEIAAFDNLEDAKLLYQYSRYYRPTLTMVSSEDGFSYRSSISVIPGSDVALPALRTSKKSLIFKGWGTEEGVVTYEAGSSIAMPVSDMTLYAVFESDPELVQGASVDIIDMKVNGKDTLTIPRNSQFDFSFSVKNTGSENLSDIRVKFDSDDPLLVILTDELSARYLESYTTRTANCKVITKAASGTVLKGLITVTDSNEKTWTKDITFTVE